MAELLSLIDEVETVETKNKLAACLSTIVDRSRAEVPSFWGINFVSLIVYQITPSVPLITSALPQLCKFDLTRVFPNSFGSTTGVSAGGESHFKITLLRMMTVLITVSPAILLTILADPWTLRQPGSTQLPWPL